MPNLLPQSPLMQPFTWQSQDYFASQYFHQQYLANSQAQAKIKYQRHQDFVRLMRSIEAYHLYCGRGDIVILQWVPHRDEGGCDPAYLQQIKQLEPLFVAVGYQTLYGLNATAQVAMSHHLDDEISQQLSVAASTLVARDMTKRSTRALVPDEHAARSLAALLEIGRLLGTPTHIVQQEAAKMIQASSGVNIRPFLLAAPAQSTIAPEDEMLEPKDLAKQLGLPSAIAVNRLLEQVGWQVKRIGGDWEPTPAGAPFAARHAWTADHGAKHGYNQRWRRTAVAETLHAHGLLPPDDPFNTTATPAPDGA